MNGRQIVLFTLYHPLCQGNSKLGEIALLQFGSGNNILQIYIYLGSRSICVVCEVSCVHPLCICGNASLYVT
jgi:hypothetical protein